jgi:hypothetical protein
MRVWRTLKATGCGVLRDGVYILPADAARARALLDLESAVRSAGGFAMTVELIAAPEQMDHVRTLFDRTRDYATLVQKMNIAKSALRRLGKRKAETSVTRLKRAFEDIAAIDFYPGHSRTQATEVLGALEREAHDLFVDGEPRSSRARVRKLDPAKYRGRTWATRKKPWVDRLACAWLIRRFIDTKAKFVWIERPADCPKRAIGFDFDGAEFTHAGDRISFEVLLSSFGLEGDPALVSIGEAVHFLDIGGIPVADAKGLETVLSGIRETAQGDDGMAREAGRIFDLFYEAYDRRQTETPPA